MSSDRTASSLNANALHLVRSVLVTAGLRGVNSDASSDKKRDALLFLTAEFRNGAKTKSSLLKALTGRNPASTADISARRQPSDGAIDRWIEEGGR